MRTAERLVATCGTAIAVMTTLGTGTALASHQPTPQTETAWQQEMAQLPVPASGCYGASFPLVQWRPVPCATAPQRPMEPVSAPQPASSAPAPVGDGNDYSANVSGVISQATGTFPYVSPNIAEEGRIGGVGPLLPNTFTLQLNTQFFSGPPVCAGSSDPSKCQGWQQFVYETDVNMIFMQYWLLDYGASCPSGWFSALSTDCYRNSPAGVYAGGPLTASGLATISLVGSTVLGGNDSVSITSKSGQSTLVSNSDSVLQLAKSWNTTEFGIFGDGGGSEAYFGAGTTLAVATSLQSTSPSAPTCVKEGFTAETNNLGLAHTPAISAQASPTVVSLQQNGKATTPNCSVAPLS